MPFPAGESTRLLAGPDAQLMRITTTTTIGRPAHAVWDLVGHRFADASVWASSVDISHAVGGPKLAGAPSGARECRVAVPGADLLVEELVAYDDVSMSLTYVLAEGMQQVARSARNTWSVTHLSEEESELRIDAEVDLSPTGRILAPVLRPYLAAMVRRNADDLKVYVQTGAPSHRKQRQQSGAGTLASLIAGNALFTTLSGAALTIASRWWARQFGGVAEPVITVLGTSLLVYAVWLAWISGRDVTARTGRMLSLLDAAWVGATAGVLGLAGSGFSGVGLLASVTTALVVAGFGWSQWRASGRVDRLSRLGGGTSAGDGLRRDGALSPGTS